MEKSIIKMSQNQYDKTYSYTYGKMFGQYLRFIEQIKLGKNVIIKNEEEKYVVMSMKLYKELVNDSQGTSKQTE